MAKKRRGAEIRPRNPLQTAPYTKMFRPMIYDPDIGDAELRTYMAIVQRCGGKDRTWISNAGLAKDRGVSVRSVRYHVEALVKRGLLTVDERPGRTNLIVIEDPSQVYGEAMFAPLPRSEDDDTPATDCQGTPAESCQGTPATSCHRRKKKRREKKEGRRNGADAPPTLWELEHGDSSLVDEGLEDARGANGLHGLVIESEDAPRPSNGRGPSTTHIHGRSKHTEAPLKPTGVSGGPVFMVWAEFWAQMNDRFKMAAPRKMSGREAGQLKTVIRDYSEQQAVAMARLIVWDFEALQAKVWQIRDKERPAVDDLVKVRRDLAVFLEHGCTSQQHRVSRYAKRFLRKEEKSDDGGGGWDFLEG